MPGSREDLMVRLLAILNTVSGIEQTTRNRGLLQNEKRPAQVLLDGDEIVELAFQRSNKLRGRGGLMEPQLMRATPQIFYLPREKRPRTDDPSNIGTEANAWLAQVQNKIWNDTALAALLGSNGSLVYNACETDLKSGSAMSGEVRLDFYMIYLLQP